MQIIHDLPPVLRRVTFSQDGGWRAKIMGRNILASASLKHKAVMRVEAALARLSGGV